MKNGAMRRAGLVLALALLTMGLATAVVGTGGGGKIKICHFPPGNPANVQIIEISQNAWNAHEAHGDFKIESREDKKRCKYGTTTSSSIPEDTTTTTVGDTTTTTQPEESSTTTVPEEPSTTLPINPEIPTLINTDACGGSDQVYLPDDSAEVTYLVDGEASGPRVLTHNVPGESRDVVITAVAADGSVLATYEFTIDRQEDCAEVSSTVVTLPGDGSGSSTPELTELPFTGSEDLPLVFVAAGLLALGGLVLAASRKGRLDG